MEKVLFDWSGWEGDHECMNFYDVVLKQDIGPYKIGTKFDSAAIQFETGILQFYNIDGEVISEHKLKLVLV